jgi:hypothetical protein
MALSPLHRPTSSTTAFAAHVATLHCRARHGMEKGKTNGVPGSGGMSDEIEVNFVDAP